MGDRVVPTLPPPSIFKMLTDRIKHVIATNKPTKLWQKFDHPMHVVYGALRCLKKFTILEPIRLDTVSSAEFATR